MPIKVADRLSCISVSGILRMIMVARTLPDVVGLHVGEPDFPTPAHIMESAADFLRSGRVKYVPSQGLPDLREAIARKLKTENDVQVEASDVIVTAGATEAIFLAVMATTDPGDEVIVFEPGFGNFSGTARVASAFPVRLGYRVEDGFAKVDEAALREAVTPRTKAMVINSPNNPTGSVFPRGELEKIAEVAIPNNIAVISDEVYDRIVYDGVKPVSMAAIPGMEDLTITLNSFSKTYAMTGLRIGYLATPNEALMQKLMALQENVMICVSPLVQAAALTALTGPQEC
ncbi:MAG: pyridoxal phosphate-dependent aminotransferase, partial [Candidatus Bathyarchaeia archaeon]